MISISDALKRILLKVNKPETILISLDQATGFSLAETVKADRDYPPFHRSTMDGFALKSKDYETGKVFTYQTEVSAGMKIKLRKGERIVKIMTGAPVPDGLDTVIKFEDSKDVSQEGNLKMVRFVPTKIKSGQNIAKQGEDLRKGQTVISSGTIINASVISLLASLGKDKVRVFSPPKVSIVSTGNEVVSIEAKPKPFQIRDSNSHGLTSFLKKFGITPLSVNLVPDEEPKIQEALKQGLTSEILLITGGVSMGSLDLIPSVLSKLGVQEIFHKVELKPGKPIWFGRTKSCVVFALPGNPFSVQVCARLFVEPYIRKFLSLPESSTLNLPILQSRSKGNKLPEYFPALLENNLVTGVLPKKFNGSGDITAGLLSDGIALHPADKPEIKEGEVLEFLFW
ncbi:molybdopterin molybdenumtransferase MoeA [Leptospira perolatii]|uniref:Molybdopterin molybdenumtransferase n=1 Tax=Leptospira perolatii TaxID=2023191 RepID=A0A2M9ZRR7_9LEPT|nr:molybdopterin molybdotransferase MoeA [Leptospira perolatii]PJZ71201.1 molybdopterin molybdenumtransferase MoeA [Leptospira perolatii]PJZ74734.1 molybdopterin molybdenumtransferase MoeA [Leptospira perolatii]